MGKIKILRIGRHGIAPQKPEGGSEDWLEGKLGCLFKYY